MNLKHCNSCVCKPATALRPGTRFDHDGEKYILAIADRWHYILVNLENGNRWTDAVTEVQMRRELKRAGFKEVAA